MLLSDEEFVERMRARCFTGDEELDHIIADDILCDFLLLLGYDELVDTFRSVSKCYA